MNRTFASTTEGDNVTQTENYQRTLLASLLGLMLAVLTNGCSGSPTPTTHIKPVIEYIAPATPEPATELLQLPSQRVVLTSRVLDAETGETLETVKTCHFLPGKIPCLAGTF